MKNTLIFITFALISILMIVGCESNPAATTTPTTVPTTITTTAPTTKATTAPTATSTTSNMHGGVFKGVLDTAPARPIGYPAEGVGASQQVVDPCLERLALVKEDGSLEPKLATAWKVADDGKSVTLTLRKGVKFHDGSDFNADVCKWNLDLQIAAKQSDAAAWKSIDKVDDYTIRINLENYQNTILTGLTSGMTEQISKAYVEKNGIEAARWFPVGTGPFIFESYERDAKLTFKRNPNYWDPPKPYLDGITMTVIRDATIRKLAFQKGDLHVFTPANLLDAKTLQESGLYQVRTDSGGPATKVLFPDSMNLKSPWANLNVRFAASYALDRELLANGLGFGFAIPAYQIFQGIKSVQVPGLIPTKYNPERAKQLLRDAGYPEGFKTTIYNDTGIPADYINAVAAQLRAMGINAAVEFPTKAKFDEMRYGTWNGMLSRALANMDNKNKTFTMYFTGLAMQSVKKPSGWLEGVEASLDSPEENPQLIQNVIRIMYDDMMVIPYIEQLQFLFKQKGVNSPRENEFGSQIILWPDVWLDKSLR